MRKKRRWGKIVLRSSEVEIVAVVVGEKREECAYGSQS